MADIDFGDEFFDCICDGVLARLYAGVLARLQIAKRARLRHERRYDRKIQILKAATKMETMRTEYRDL